MDAIAGGVVDELGIGTIRDKYSNLLFTGISTLYTRAKYYFITPYILIDREQKQKPGETGIQYFQRCEVSTNRIIKNYYTKKSKNEESYFGKDTESGELKRQPSEIYWNGIVHLGLVQDTSSLYQLLKTKKSSTEALLSRTSDCEGTKEQGAINKQDNICVSYSTDWQEIISNYGLSLTRTEAELLNSRIPEKAPHSLITALLQSETLWEQYNAPKESYEDAEDKRIPSLSNPFTRFVEGNIDKITDRELKNNLIEAHDLAIFLHGLHIAYNIALWEAIEIDTDFINNLRTSGQDWRDSLNSRLLCKSQLGCDFDINKCIESSRPQDYTKKFLHKAYQLVFENTSWSDFEKELKAVCKNQERTNKKMKSRFYKLEHKQTIPDMDLDNCIWIGLPLIPYRYHAARSIVYDIYAGMNNVN